jgi:glycosyltransferase 2 family protein
MAWIRRTEEPPERRPGDVVRVVAGTVGVLLAGLWAQGETSVDANIFETVNDFPNGLQGAADGVYALGSIWAVIGVTLVLLALKKWHVALHAAIAGVLAWGIAELLHEILEPQSITGLGIDVRTGDGPSFPATNVAIITALALVLAPYVVRPVRRVLAVLIVLICLAAMYLAAAFPSDVVGGLFLGIATAGAVLAVFGAPGGRPTLDEVRDGLTALGFDVADVAHADLQVPRAAVMDVRLTSGEQLRVDAYGRDQRDGQVAAKAWHWIMYRDPGVPVFGNRLQQTEHIGYALVLADRAKVRVPTLVRTGAAGPEAAMLITNAPLGTPLDEIGVAKISDAVLSDAWKQIHRLHDAGISHGTLDGHHVLVQDSKVAFDDFSAADANANQYWIDRDSAGFLVATALLVGNDRAIAAAVEVLGKKRVAELIPFVQPAALPPRVSRGQKHLSKTLKGLREDLTKVTGAEDVPPLKIKRLSLVNIGMLAGILLALAIAIPSLEGIDWDSLTKEFENATWGWAALAFVLWPTIPTAWGTALMGCVNKDLPFIPTVTTQISCTFLNLITPNGIGGTALQVDYLHHQDVPVASAGSAMVLSTGVGGIIQIILFVGAASLTSTQFTLGGGGGSVTLGAIAVGAALVGVVLFVPKIHDKVVPAVKKAASDIWAVVRNPRKGMQLLGGDLAGNLLYPALLGLCLKAFGYDLGFAELMVVQIGAGMLGSVAPVPGGIGVQEAALTAGLTGFGIPTNPALAAVIVFRAITFGIPPVIGFFTLRWQRAHGYV